MRQWPGPPFYGSRLGRLCGKIGCTKVIFIGFVTYAVTQIAFYSFGYAGRDHHMPSGRRNYLFCRSGSHTGRPDQSYRSRGTEPGYALLFGFVNGGLCGWIFDRRFLGSISIELAFQIQVVAIFLFALILLLTVRDPEPAWEERSLPDQKKSGSNITVLLAVFMASVFCASFATTAYDNAYNYYVKEALKFPNYYNGLIRAGIGALHSLWILQWEPG